MFNKMERTEEEKKDIEIMIKCGKEDIEMLTRDWNKIAIERLASVYEMLGDACKEIGVGTLLSGNKKEALEWFKKSVEYYKKAIENGDKTGHRYQYEFTYGWLIESALLTQDEKIIKEIAQHMCDVEETVVNNIMKIKDGRLRRFPMLLYHIAFILPNLIVGNDDKTKEHLNYFEKRKTLLSDEYPITDAVKGILERDPKLIKEGIDKILKRHSRIKRALPSSDRLLCIPAVCKLTIAKLKGIDINDIFIENKYIPKILFFEK